MASALPILFLASERGGSVVAQRAALAHHAEKKVGAVLSLSLFRFRGKCSCCWWAGAPLPLAIVCVPAFALWIRVSRLAGLGGGGGGSGEEEGVLVDGGVGGGALCEYAARDLRFQDRSPAVR